MTQFLLVRHAHCPHVGLRLAGRMTGIALSERGRLEAERLAQDLAGETITAIYSSPLERALQTAHAIAAHHRLPVIARAALTDIDFGAWTGATFNELENDPDWHAFNTRRSTTPIPAGEHPRDVQARAVAEIRALSARHPDGRIVVVTHADVIRSIVVHARGMPLDDLLQIEVAPASITPLMLPAEPAPPPIP